jgi:hypothetical protein
MLISRNTPPEGVCYAWLPTWTPEGKVWFERVHYRWIDHGFGGWEYARWIPEDRYQAGERRRFLGERPHQPVKTITESYKRVGDVSCMDRLVEFEARETWEEEQERLRANPPKHYATPPDYLKCRNLRDDGPTPCWYPSCSCMRK